MIQKILLNFDNWLSNFHAYYTYFSFNTLYGVIHIGLIHKGGREGSSQMRTIALKGEGWFQGCVRTQKEFFGKISKLFFVCTKEVITLSFIFVYRKV